VLILASCSGGSGIEELLAEPHAGGQLVVQLEDPDDEDGAEDLLDDLEGTALRRIGETSFFVLELPPGADVEKALEDLHRDARVIESSPDYLGHLPEGGPRDLPTVGSDVIEDIPAQAAFTGLDLDLAHTLARGAGVVVAVVDTGIDLTHPLLSGSVEPTGFDFIDGDFDPSEERDFEDNDSDGLVDEQFGHGTFVASLVLAVAPEARILPVRSLNDEGVGTTSTIAAGIVWAADHGARIINVSVDIPSAPDAVKEAIRVAESRDIVVVGAAGNDGDMQVIFPARFSAVIGVTATDASGIVPDFANVGSQVSLVAPGVDLIGAYPISESAFGTARWSGTSFAAPIVSGAAALVRSRHGHLVSEEVARLLEDTALSVDELNPLLAGRLGAGLVQPAPALASGG
jgi:subtilisin family serine protease